MTWLAARLLQMLLRRWQRWRPHHHLILQHQQTGRPAAPAQHI
jgi:hypothetical protein